MPKTSKLGRRSHGLSLPHADNSGLIYLSFFGGTAQPPLPLQEFFALQPASPVLQPPWPLQSFCPLQSCLAALVFFGGSSAPKSAEPAAKPAAAVPRAMVNFLRFINCL